MTANAVASLSLEPLLLLVAFDNTARTLQRRARHAGASASTCSAAGQEELARLFASKAPEDAKFAGVPHTVHDGLPVIDGAIAWVGCRLERLVDGGDHTIGIGAVESRGGRRRAAAAVVPRGLPDVTAFHAAIGIAMVVVNLAAGLIGAWRGGARRYIGAFWPLLRLGQALMALAAIDGAGPRPPATTCPSCTSSTGSRRSA